MHLGHPGHSRDLALQRQAHADDRSGILPTEHDRVAEALDELDPALARQA
jgi:hypothetical protein